MPENSNVGKRVGLVVEGWFGAGDGRYRRMGEGGVQQGECRTTRNGRWGQWGGIEKRVVGAGDGGWGMAVGRLGYHVEKLCAVGDPDIHILA